VDALTVRNAPLVSCSLAALLGVGPLEIVVPPPNASQPPHIHRQEELVELLEDDPNVRISRGYGRGRDGAYWLHQGYESSNIELVDPDGVRVWSHESLGAQPGPVARELALVARRELWHRALLQLDDVSSGAQVSGRFEACTEEELARTRGRPAGEIYAAPGGGLFRLNARDHPVTARARDLGPRVTLVVTSGEAEPLYMAVLSVGEDRHRELLFPLPGSAPDVSRLEGGNTRGSRVAWGAT